jgi:hypothetical protein
LQTGLQLCSLFELFNRSDRHRRIAVEVRLFEDRLDDADAVAGDGRDLELGRAGKREPSDRGAAQIVKGQTRDAGALARLAPGRAEAV